MGTAAQPTLTMSNNGYAVGDEYRFFVSNFDDDGADGAGSTWDLSTYMMGETPDQVQTAIIPSASLLADFPSANIALELTEDGETVYSMYKVSESGLANYGMQLGEDVQIVYTNPEELLRYPMTVGTSYTDDFYGVFSSPGMTMPRGGSTTVEVTGYGALITPEGSYPSALKVRTHQVYADTMMDMPMISYDYDIYQWFVPGYHIALAGITYITSPSPMTRAGFTATDGTSALGKVIALKDLITFYPNPATEQVIISNTGSRKLERIYITDIAGNVKFSYDGAIANQVRAINISSLPAANYILHVVAEGGIRAGEVIVKK